MLRTGFPDAPRGRKISGSILVEVGVRTRGTGLMIAVLVAWLVAVAPAGATVWTSQTVPSVSVPAGQLLSVSCPSVTDCIGVGSGFVPGIDASPGGALAERWNGHRWVLQPGAAAALGVLESVSCVSVRECVAVGLDGAVPGPARALIERWNGRWWSIDRSARRFSVSLTGVSCVISAACVAVGNDQRALAVLRWNGRRWSMRSLPAPRGATSQLSAVSCAGPRDCEAVGSSSYDTGAFSGLSAQTVVLAERWNGRRWAIQPSGFTPEPGGEDSALSAVSCASPTRGCTAVGTVSNEQLAVRLVGRQWVTDTGAIPLMGALNGVSCTSPRACTAVGATNFGPDAAAFAETWNGRGWSTEPAPGAQTVGGSSLAGVSCPSPGTCTAVGTIDHGTGTLTLAARWQGSRLRTQATPNPLMAALVTLNAVSCPTASVCTAAGYLHNAASHWQPVAIREAGAGWSAESPATPSGAINSQLEAVSCPTSTACTAVGVAQVGKSTVSLAEVWDGTAWTVTSLPLVPAGSPALAAVSCTAENACTAVGQQGGAGSDTSSARTLAERWDGTRWAVQSTPSPGPYGSALHGVACTSARACVAVGWYQPPTGPGRMLGLLWNGATWSQSATSSSGYQDAVSCPAANACLELDSGPATGNVWNGATWSPVALPTTGLDALSCALATACTAVGAGAATWDGTAWTAETIPGPPTDFTGISCPAATVCTAIGFGRDSEKPVIDRSS